MITLKERLKWIFDQLFYKKIFYGRSPKKEKRKKNILGEHSLEKDT